MFAPQIVSRRAMSAAAQSARQASTVTGIRAREVLDSRGNPTVEVDLTTEDGLFRAIVPSGASTGIHEAVELRDGGDRYMGKGVLKAVENANTEIADKVKGMDVTDQAKIDEAMIALDGTKNKGRLGANAILAVSMAAAKAGAASKKVPLYQHFADLAGNTQKDFVMPTVMLNVINGGSHAGNPLAFQEFFMIPTGADSFAHAMQIGAECYHNLKKVIKSKYGGDATLIGDEGGFGPPCDAKGGLELLMEAVDKAGYSGRVKVGLDVASSEFYVTDGAQKGSYDLDHFNEDKDPANVLSPEKLIAYYRDLADNFPIMTIEDPMDQDAWEDWKQTTASLSELQIVGDDLLCTNPEKIKKAIAEKSCNALLLKVNQIGSISESIEAVKMAKQAGWGVMTSHRSGETEDSTIADLAVGLCTGQIKTGAPARSDRNAKYNQLLRIEEELAGRSSYAGENFRTTSWMGN
ncbi:Enolase [Hondaea fermentalgiana]|uniref:phosphopyruvate hydratase n=1 Tax=Hondaea fermentalgiana TaxID=2315210 RepID=A0A2R5GKC1_9STRA|nr:Enolase [Hondaea fermentalgiana]|eukprot:GBG28731.1 Enolase [Hondaea fermentalgiana]